MRFFGDRLGKEQCMGSLTERFLARERESLSEFAFLTENTKGRLSPLAPSEFRTEFQRDRDRIIHSKSFRRLMHKTQVFFAPVDEHYCTRMTHTLEVTQISRIIARALSLNEDLTEAIALGHDLGHTPFGHAGETALRRCFDETFSHAKQSLRVVDHLDKLNLTYEVRDGILNHSGSSVAETLEGVVVRFADRIAYINHDFDDACRAGVLSEDDLPFDIRYTLGDDSSSRINTMVSSIVENSDSEIRMADDIQRAADSLREFMFTAVYRDARVKGEEQKAQDMLIRLYEHYIKNPDKLPRVYLDRLEEDGLPACAADYVAGMTDRYAIETYKEIFVPRVWRD